MIGSRVRRLDDAAELGRSLIEGLVGAALLVVDTDLHILHADGEVHQRLQVSDVVGRRVPDVVPAAAWEALRPHYAKALEGEAQSFDYKALRHRSVYGVRMSPVRAGGEVIGVVVLSEDVTARALAAARLAESERLQRSVLEVLDAGVLVLDLEGRLLHANPAARTMLGLDPATALTDPEWWRPLGARYVKNGTPLNADALRSTLGRRISGFQVQITGPDGITALLLVNQVPLHDEAGADFGIVLSFRDVTARDRDHKSLIKTQDRLREAHEVARLASWEWGAESNEIQVFHALVGSNVASGTRAPLDELLEMVPEDARQEVYEALAAIVAGERDDGCVRYARELPTGPTWIETRARAVRDADGKLLCIRGTSQNVTEQHLAEREAAQARDFFQATLDSLPAHIAVLDDRGEIVMTNQAWEQFAVANGAAADAAPLRNYLAACDSAVGDEQAAQTAAGLRAILSGHEAGFTLEYPCHSPTQRRWFTLRAARFEGPGSARVVVAHDNVTQRREAEDKVATQAALLDEVDVAVVAVDTSGLVTHWTRGAVRQYGWTPGEAVGRDVRDVMEPLDRADLDPVMVALGAAGHWEGEAVVRRKDGSTFPAYIRDRLMHDGDGRPAGMIAVSVDMTERVAVDRALREAGDYLRAVADSMGEGMFTLDAGGRLSYMNHAAEALLGWTGEELVGEVMPVIAHHHPRDGSALAVEDCPIVAALQHGRTIRIEDDIFVRRDSRAIPVAYTAAPFATDDGAAGCVVVFQDVSERKAHEESLQRDADKLLWIGRIREALEEDRFMLYAQPIIDLGSGAIVQRELLLRLREPDGNVVGPGAYLDIAEQYGLIGEIDRWVIRRGVEIAATGLPVEINISGCSIGDPDLLAHIERCLQDSGADPTSLVFEITETALVQDEAAARVFATHLRQLGCKLALDDFGTGYGGFTHLKQLPMDYLKVDIEFVRDLASDPASRHVVEAVVALSRAFGLRTVAEGVEDEPTLGLLRELGVDFAQGYHIARPAPLDTSSQATNGVSP